ncbi:VOC family protein [Nonomuraea sp. NPDC050451]|uniref:VOC family protein n=1 Tax=Nonomuraea sp. NPDC050451 TaxID=3364364 RepID=UPI00379DA7DB
MRFWATLLGGDPVDRARGWSHVEPPGGVRLAFQPVAEDKAVKNRLHLDIEVDAIESATTQALRLGATRIGETVTGEVAEVRRAARAMGRQLGRRVRTHVYDDGTVIIIDDRDPPQEVHELAARRSADAVSALITRAQAEARMRRTSAPPIRPRGPGEDV